MTQNSTAAGGTVTHRSGSSRRLLARKALALAPAARDGAGNGVLPVTGDTYGPWNTANALAGSGADPALPESETASAVQPAPATAEVGADALDITPPEPAGAPPGSVAAEPGVAPLPGAAWSSEDEVALQALVARRKAAGFQRRGRNVSGQLLCIGSVTPNSGTVVATIVALVVERGTVARADLLTAMAGATFANAKARPADATWANGYVAGAVRDGFLAVAAVPVSEGEPSTAVSL